MNCTAARAGGTLAAPQAVLPCPLPPCCPIRPPRPDAIPRHNGSFLLAAPQVWTQAPQGLGLLVLYWSLLYLATAIQEDKCHVD